MGSGWLDWTDITIRLGSDKGDNPFIQLQFPVMVKSAPPPSVVHLPSTVRPDMETGRCEKQPSWENVKIDDPSLKDTDPFCLMTSAKVGNDPEAAKPRVIANARTAAKHPVLNFMTSK
jgi:hypothetical protein